MPIYKQDESGKFVPFEQTPFPDLERVLEDWVEDNPHLFAGRGGTRHLRETASYWIR